MGHDKLPTSTMLTLLTCAGLFCCSPRLEHEDKWAATAVKPDSDPFGSHFQVNGSTSPSVVTQMGYVKLELLGGTGITHVGFLGSSGRGLCRI
jgi:hypothetical protein